MHASAQVPIRNARVIYDVLYGFVPITEWEEAIINSPFFQRLRWIKQLGFANYIFPGAEHSRFSHVVGVMHSMDQMLRNLGLSVPDDELFDRKATSEAALLHKSLRIAALLHDVGTFPFSHATEAAFIRHGSTGLKLHPSKKDLPNSHEHLGSFIIKNTNYEGGITRTLEEYGFDVGLISKIIKGTSPYLIANQLMHSDLDADRMDYLMRDAHYTGIKYGQFDRDYVLANLITYNAGRNQIGFGLKSNAVHAVEDFLIARYYWYSQVIKNPASAKFDIMATHVSKAFLEKNLMFQFHDLLSMIESRGERFFWWNDAYFISRCQEARYNHLIRDPMVSDLTEMLLYRISPKTVPHPIFSPRIIEEKKAEAERSRLVAQILQLVDRFAAALKKHGSGHEWILVDIPENDVIFAKGVAQIIKKRTHDNLLMERDPIRIVDKHHAPSLLVENENSLMKRLSGTVYFVPSVYANAPAIEILKNAKLVEEG